MTCNFKDTFEYGEPEHDLPFIRAPRSNIAASGIMKYMRKIPMEIPLLLGRKFCPGQSDQLILFIRDLAAMKQILVTGARKSGKSALIRTMILGLVHGFSMRRLRLIIMAENDEFDWCKNLPHIKEPVIREPEKILDRLADCVGEIGRREKVFAQNNLPNISTYNKGAFRRWISSKIGGGAGTEWIMPYLIVIIDGLSDLLLPVHKEKVESLLEEISLRGPAAGVHWIISTRRTRGYISRSFSDDVPVTLQLVSGTFAFDDGPAFETRYVNNVHFPFDPDELEYPGEIRELLSCYSRKLRT